MLNKTFYSITDQNVVFAFKVDSVTERKQALKIVTSLIDDNPKNSIVFHHEEYLKSFHVTKNILESKTIFENELDASEFASKELKDDVEYTEKLLNNAKNKLNAMNAKIKALQNI